MNMHIDDIVPDSRRKRRTLRVLIVLAGSAVLIGAGLGAHVALGPPAAARDARSDLPPLPEIRFQDAAGKPLTLVGFRGKVVLLNIWATWCVPCRKEMPALDRLQQKPGGPGFEVVALSIDHSPQAVREFYHQYGMKSLALYVDPSGEAASALGAIGIPTTLLVDRAGREIWRRVGPAEWDAPPSVEAIRKHLVERPKPGARPSAKRSTGHVDT